MPARHDRVGDSTLAAALLTARRGTAYFTRKLAELADDDFAGPSLLPGWSRAHVIAHVGYNARALTRLLEWATTGVETPMYGSAEQRAEEIEAGATLKPVALRHLVAHSTVHLNVEWRDLPKEAWTAQVRTAQGRVVPVSETVWMRTREVWVHAVDLNNGGRFDDAPPALIDALAADVIAGWARRQTLPDIVLSATDRTNPTFVGDALRPVSVSGTAADLLSWATGRDRSGLVVSAGALPDPPAWL